LASEINKEPIEPVEKNKPSKASVKNKKRYVTFKNNTASKQIIDMLLLYGECSVDQIVSVAHKKEQTIRKAVCKLESLGYINSNNVWQKKIIRLSKSSKEHFGIIDSADDKHRLDRDRKIIRSARNSEIKMAFHISEPHGHIDYIDRYIEIASVKGKRPDMPLKLSRMYGIYSHGQKHYIVYNIGGGMAWIQGIEQKAKEWVRDKYLNAQVNASILFTPDMGAINRMLNHVGGRQKLSIYNTIYNEMVAFPLSREGHEQLRLFRSLPNPYIQLPQVIFSKDEINKYGHNLYDGMIKNNNGSPIPTVVLFICDVMRIDRVIGLLSSNAVPSIYVACYDTQEDFIREALKEFPQAEILSYSFKAICQRLLG